MRRFLSSKNTTYILVGTVFLLALALIITWALHSKYEDRGWLETVLQKTVKKIQLVNTMRINLLASAEAEKSSVMADTDEASQAFAEQSMSASEAVEEARREITRLMDGEDASQETDLFRQFGGCWEKLRDIDREILPLSVQNTNLKALRLSFVPAAEAIKGMETALGQLMDSSASFPDALRITRLASRALTNALNIYTIQAPHIAETTDTKMDEMEAIMKSLDAQVTDALGCLQALVDDQSKPLLDAAWTSYKDFRRINVEIVDLSRRNSNIRSFAISLGQKRKVMAQCQDLLSALEETFQKSTVFKATR